MSLIKDIYDDYEKNKLKYRATSPTFTKSSRVQPREFVNKGKYFKAEQKRIEYFGYCTVKTVKVEYRIDNNKKVVDKIKTVTVHRKSKLSRRMKR